MIKAIIINCRFSNLKGLNMHIFNNTFQRNHNPYTCHIL